MSYASDTSVPVDRSKAEIERLLMRYGASQFMYGVSADRVNIAFQMKNRAIRFALPLPATSSFNISERGRRRTASSAQQAYEQEVRRLWRALTLVIKAKLEAVESGIFTFEQEWMSHIVMPDRKTIGEHVLPLVEEAYKSGRVPALMLSFGGGS